MSTKKATAGKTATKKAAKATSKNVVAPANATVAEVVEHLKKGDNKEAFITQVLKDAKKVEKKAAKKKDAKKAAPKKEAVKKEKQVQERDTKTYKFDGKVLGKGPMVLAIVKHWVKAHPKCTLKEALEVFPNSLISRYGVICDLKTAKERSTNKKRYFINEDQVFQIGGKPFVCCNQITAAIMVKFMEHLKAQGLKVK